MAINGKRVIVGGLAAGVVRNLGDGLWNTLLSGATYNAALAKWNPSLPATVGAPSAKIGFVTINLLLGIALVFVYAAIRPRFGAGARTAVKSGLLAWAIATLVWSLTVVMGIFPWYLLVVRSLASLVTVLAAACVGGFLYSESSAPSAATLREPLSMSPAGHIARA